MKAEDAVCYSTSVLGEPDAELMTEINMGLLCRVSSGGDCESSGVSVPLDNGIPE